MSQAVWFALAVLLALPFLAGFCTVLTSTAFVAEFLSEGRWRPLSSVTAAPSVRPLPARAPARPVPADLYTSPALIRRPALVSVHGLSPAGKDDPRLREAAGLLARAGWVVAVPTVDGLTTLRLRPQDAEAVVATVEALQAVGYAPVAVLGISLGAGPALLAAVDPRAASSVSAVLALGGYASAVEFLGHGCPGSRPDQRAVYENDDGVS